MYYEDIGVETLLGKTLIKAEQVGDDEILFTTDKGEEYKMYHSQYCCESVRIEDINGELQDIIGSPILVAEANSNSDNPKKEEAGYNDEDGNPVYYTGDSHTWTFYKIATIKGQVDIRWYGHSNGYYSESVDFVWLNNPKDKDDE